MAGILCLWARGDWSLSGSGRSSSERKRRSVCCSVLGINGGGREGRELEGSKPSRVDLVEQVVCHLGCAYPRTVATISSSPSNMM